MSRLTGMATIQVSPISMHHLCWSFGTHICALESPIIIVITIIITTIIITNCHHHHYPCFISTTIISIGIF